QDRHEAEAALIAPAASHASRNVMRQRFHSLIQCRAKRSRRQDEKFCQAVALATPPRARLECGPLHRRLAMTQRSDGSCPARASCGRPPGLTRREVLRAGVALAASGAVGSTVAKGQAGASTAPLPVRRSARVALAGVSRQAPFGELGKAVREAA